ncbi:Nucleoporin NDC1 [Rhizophlyctis rosea]|uniref:Nucleoporin NDC1 n=1 Tax=Rhizophlyctis rosea TaxID=64517 RepID=A0AAD5SEE0_9FUNG|nr:Nucleoporin NDC1 [Rhizophlyctis rosea]
MENLGSIIYFCCILTGRQLNNPQLNASAVYLAWFSILLGPAYALVRRYRERDVFAFPLQRRKSKFYTIKSRLANTLKTSLVFTVKYIVAFALLHFVFGGAFFRVASTFAAPLVRGGLLKRNEYASAWIDLWSLIYVFGCGLLTVSAWEMSSQIFEAFFMEPVTMSDWDQSLKFFFNKLQDGQQAYYQQLAFLELWQLTRYDAKKRSYILNHLEADPVKPWHSMANACTAVINDFSTVLEDDVAPSKATPKGDDLPNLRSAIPARAPPSSSVRHENIMSPPKKQTFLQSAYSKLLDEDQAPKTTQRAYLRAGNAAPAPRTNSAYGNIPDLLRPSAPVVDANGLRSVGAEKRKGVAVKKGVNASGLVVKGLEKVKWGRWVVEMGRRYWGESLERRTARVFENATVVTWAVRALSSIVVASATEDRFGTVSQDLGPLLECLLRCLIALEEYSVRVGNQMRRRSHSSNGRLGRQVVARSNLMMINELQTCIYAITNKFRDHLKDKKFRDPYAERLQGFVDFRE